MQIERRSLLLAAGGAALFAPGLSAIWPAADAQPVVPCDIMQRLAVRFQNAAHIEIDEADLPTSFASSSAPLVVWSDRLKLRGTYQTGGRSFMIVTRELVCSKNARIITAGIEGQPNHREGDRAESGRDAGVSGHEGATGGAAFPSGAFALICQAMSGSLGVWTDGAPGGRGQDGGNGATGARGPQGAQCQVGGTGGRGGAGGRGGKGGDGGEAGEIFVRFEEGASRRSPVAITSSAARGAAGSGGRSGAPGDGGAGGPGGKENKYFEPTDKGGGGGWDRF